MSRRAAPRRADFLPPNARIDYPRSRDLRTHVGAVVNHATQSEPCL